jgi:hypothetical protein
LSDNVVQIIRVKLEAYRASYAQSALTQPGDPAHAAFLYGRAVGHNLALSHALALIDQSVKEDRDRDRDERKPTFEP